MQSVANTSPRSPRGALYTSRGKRITKTQLARLAAKGKVVGDVHKYVGGVKKKLSGEQKYKALRDIAKTTPRQNADAVRAEWIARFEDRVSLKAGRIFNEIYDKHPAEMRQYALAYMKRDDLFRQRRIREGQAYGAAANQYLLKALSYGDLPYDLEEIHNLVIEGST